MIKSMIGLLAGWRGYAAALAVGAAVAGYVAWAIQAGNIARIELRHSQEQHARDRASLAAYDRLITENARRYAALEAERDTAHKAAAAARTDAAGQRAAAERLRKRAERMVADAVARNPALADGGPAAGATFDLLAHVLSRAIDAAGQLAEYADSARIAGLTCERAYDALRGGARVTP